MIKLIDLLKEQEEEQKCPVATQDISVNLKHRQIAIDRYGYGPLNPNNPNKKFWKEKADMWKLDSIEEAKEARCNNCAAFNITLKMLNCIEKGLASGEQQVTTEEETPTQPQPTAEPKPQSKPAPAPEEAREMFYSHEELDRFDDHYRKEDRIAERMGLTWMEWKNQQPDDQEISFSDDGL